MSVYRLYRIIGSNKVKIDYKFVIYKNKEAKDDHSKEDTEPTANSTKDVNLESPSKKSTSTARQLQFVGKMADKLASGVKAVGKTLGDAFSKTPPNRSHIPTKLLYQEKALTIRAI